MDEIPEFDFNDYCSDVNQNPRVECLNVDPESFSNYVRHMKNKSFSIISYNIRSCRKNFSLFLAMLTGLMFEFTVIALYETWLTKEIDYGYNIPGYKQLNNYRNNHGGGIKVFYGENYNVEKIDELTFINEFFEILSFKILNRNLNYIVCILYRPPDSSINFFIDSFG